MSASLEQHVIGKRARNVAIDLFGIHAFRYVRGCDLARSIGYPNPQAGVFFDAPKVKGAPMDDLYNTWRTGYPVLAFFDAFRKEHGLESIIMPHIVPGDGFEYQTLAEMIIVCGTTEDVDKLEALRTSAPQIQKSMQEALFKCDPVEVIEILRDIFDKRIKDAKSELLKEDLRTYALMEDKELRAKAIERGLPEELRDTGSQLLKLKSAANRMDPSSLEEFIERLFSEKDGGQGKLRQEATSHLHALALLIPCLGNYIGARLQNAPDARAEGTAQQIAGAPQDAQP